MKVRYWNEEKPTQAVTPTSKARAAHAYSNTWLLMWPTGSRPPCYKAVLLCSLAWSHTRAIILFNILLQLVGLTHSCILDQATPRINPKCVFNQAADLDWWLILLVCELLLFAPVWHNTNLPVSLMTAPSVQGNLEQLEMVFFVWRYKSVYQSTPALCLCSVLSQLYSSMKAFLPEMKQCSKSHNPFQKLCCHTYSQAIFSMIQRTPQKLAGGGGGGSGSQLEETRTEPKPSEAYDAPHWIIQHTAWHGGAGRVGSRCWLTACLGMLWSVCGNVWLSLQAARPVLQPPVCAGNCKNGSIMSTLLSS